MKKERYIRCDWSTGRGAGLRRLVFVICAAVLPAIAGSLLAAGTGELNKVSNELYDNE